MKDRSISVNTVPKYLWLEKLTNITCHFTPVSTGFGAANVVLASTKKLNLISTKNLIPHNVVSVNILEYSFPVMYHTTNTLVIEVPLC